MKLYSFNLIAGLAGMVLFIFLHHSLRGEYQWLTDLIYWASSLNLIVGSLGVAIKSKTETDI